MLTILEKSILTTVAYFDIFKFPLTKEEIFESLWRADIQNDAPISRTDFEKALNRLVPARLAKQQGFYSIDSPNIEEKIAQRKQNYLDCLEKHKIARKNARLISRFPFVKAIFICNNLAYNNARDSADIDYLIITRTGQIWTARFLITSFISLLGRRPGKTNKNKICLSFWLTEDSLNLQELLYAEDIYLHFWLKQLMPVWDPENFLEKLWRANPWLKWRLPHAQQYAPNHLKSVALRNTKLPLRGTRLSLRAERSNLHLKLENLLQKLQYKLFSDNIKKLAQENNSDVIISDKMLKFHTNDKRLEFKATLQTKIPQ